MHEEAYYGFYVCRITVPYQRICPIAYVALQNFLYCPFGQWAAYLTKQEVEAYAPYADIEVVTGWEFIPSEIVKPFEEHITRLFEEKKKTPKEDYAYDLVKKMMNSIYGAFYEKTKGGEIIQTGVLFNPVYASIITANTRIKLFLFAKKYEKDVVALATDSVMLKGQHTVETSKDLGGWSLDGSGKTIVLMNGIYEMASKVKNRGIMSKTGQNSAKGLKTPYGVHQNIFEYMRACPGLTEYPYYSDKPVQMKEAIKSREKFTIADVNTWQIFEKSLKIDTDLKRIFTEPFGNGGNYFTKCIGSEPRMVKP